MSTLYCKSVDYIRQQVQNLMIYKYTKYIYLTYSGQISINNVNNHSHAGSKKLILVQSEELWQLWHGCV